MWKPRFLVEHEIRSLRGKALGLLAQNRYAEAEALFRKTDAMATGRLGNRHNIGIACLAQGKYEEAEKCFLHELDTYGETLSRLRVLGDLYYMWGRAEPAADYYSRSRELLDPKTNPGDWVLLERRVALCKDAERFARVKDSHEAYRRGVDEMQRSEFDQAEASFNDAFELDKTNFQALNNLGALALNHKKDPALAADFFERTVAMTDSPGFRRNLVFARSEIAKKEEEELKQARKNTRRKERQG